MNTPEAERAAELLNHVGNPKPWGVMHAGDFRDAASALLAADAKREARIAELEKGLRLLVDACEHDTNEADDEFSPRVGPAAYAAYWMLDGDASCLDEADKADAIALLSGEKNDD